MYGNNLRTRDRLLLFIRDHAANRAGRYALRGEPGGQRCGAERENRARKNEETAA